MPSCARQLKRNVLDVLKTYENTSNVVIKHSKIVEAYVEQQQINKRIQSRLQQEIRCVDIISKLYTKIQPLLDMDYFIHTGNIKDNLYNYSNESFLQQFENQIRWFKEHCCEEYAQLNDTHQQVKELVECCSIRTFTGIHLRGLLINFMLICLIQLVSSEYTMHDYKKNATRCSQLQKNSMENIRNTLCNHLYRTMYCHLYTDYDNEMKKCKDITNKPPTNTYQYGWYHSDISPHVLNMIQPIEREIHVHQLAVALTAILNHDKSYTNTIDERHAYTFMTIQCTQIYKQL